MGVLVLGVVLLLAHCICPTASEAGGAVEEGFFARMSKLFGFGSAEEEQGNVGTVRVVCGGTAAEPNRFNAQLGCVANVTEANATVGGEQAVKGLAVR